MGYSASTVCDLAPLRYGEIWDDAEPEPARRPGSGSREASVAADALRPDHHVVDPERGGKFFKAVARNPVVRAPLLARGLTEDELLTGWKLYSELNGFGSEASARPATAQTAAAVALNELDAWDAPAFAAARAVLEARLPDVSRFLLENLEATTGVAAVAGVERFLDRIAQLREAKANGIAEDTARAAVALLAVRKIVDPAREDQLRGLIATVRRGAQPDEVVLAPVIEPRKLEVAQRYITWLHEWREVARVAISRATTASNQDSSELTAPVFCGPWGFAWSPSGQCAQRELH